MGVAAKKIGFSFVVDQDPRFAYQGWHLAHSIIERLSVKSDNIFVQLIDPVDASIEGQFKNIGCRTVRIKPLGDGRYCNKIAQWNDAVTDSDRDHFVFLDTDMIFVANGLRALNAEAISAKVVDDPSPPIETLEEIIRAAGVALPAKCLVDTGGDYTYAGNCNGGMLSVPRAFADELFASWKRRTLWLLDNKGPLERVGKEMHVDEVSFCIAINETKLPFQHLPSNLNYFVHYAAPHRYYDPNDPISLLHYHHVSMNAAGLLEPPGAVTSSEKEATRQANAQIARRFNDTLFGEMRLASLGDGGLQLIGARG